MNAKIINFSCVDKKNTNQNVYIINYDSKFKNTEGKIPFQFGIFNYLKSQNLKLELYIYAPDGSVTKQKINITNTPDEPQKAAPIGKAFVSAGSVAASTNITTGIYEAKLILFDNDFPIDSQKTFFYFDESK